MGVFAYIKNRVKYKMNQFPGAYPASRVSYNGSDVETTLDELNADKANKDLSNVTGTLAVANGGTGATTATNARTNLGLGGAATQAVANNLTTTAAGSVLDARQGKALSDKILNGLKYNGRPTSIILSNYTSANPYTASSDGYALIGPNATVTFKDLGLTFNGSIATYIKKGMQLYGTASSGAVCVFSPINQTFA